jgi:hypothetical protein
MDKPWWFKFEYGKWEGDDDLSRCSFNARGFWLEIYAKMRKKNVASITGTVEDFAKMARGLPAETAAAIAELEEKNACNVLWSSVTCNADVTLGNKTETRTVTLESRDQTRKLKVREQTNLRVRRHRGHVDVTPEVTPNATAPIVRVRVRNKENTASTDALKEVVTEVFDHWRALHSHMDARLDAKRAERITARLDEQFTGEDLKLAIAGAKLDPWLMGENPNQKRYDGLQTILRDADQVERLRDLARAGPANGNGHVPSSPVVCSECEEMGGLKVVGEGAKRTTVKCSHKNGSIKDISK